MSSTQTIEKLCGMLETAQEIIREQADLLAMHGIETADGRLEERREALLREEP